MVRSYRDGYRLLTMSTFDNFIVLPHWETRLLVSWPNIPISQTVLIVILSSSYPINAQRQVTSINIKSDWLDPAEIRTPNLLHRNTTLYLFGFDRLGAQILNATGRALVKYSDKYNMVAVNGKDTIMDGVY